MKRDLGSILTGPLLLSNYLLSLSKWLVIESSKLTFRIEGAFFGGEKSSELYFRLYKFCVTEDFLRKLLNLFFSIHYFFSKSSYIFFLYCYSSVYRFNIYFIDTLFSFNFSIKLYVLILRYLINVCVSLINNSFLLRFELLRSLFKTWGRRGTSLLLIHWPLGRRAKIRSKHCESLRCSLLWSFCGEDTI